ncbi:putative U-box domain-containing protein 50 [Diospyros lotus]|uniref:putative U-box domain-containing protein 50 n=1 Tax=Diospyros lotus TaxID=55363 RepID=UPI002259A663|nr:putative U-box domain-containing protein 50 [Diospyros lotus]
METQAPEKVYVVIGSDPQDGFATLEWALRKWSFDPISIVILHAANNSSRDYVYTPFGKLPASSVSDEKLEVLKKIKQEENDKLLSDYKAFCAKVTAEILKIERYDEPLHKHLVELISGLRITKLVMGITFMKSLSWKCRCEINGLLYVYKHKPDFCELFIVRGGKLVFLREENNEGLIEDDQGAVIFSKSREKGSVRGWLGKMLAEAATNWKNLRSSPSSSQSNDSPDQWENYVQEIENYFLQLSTPSNNDQEGSDGEHEPFWGNEEEPDHMPANTTAADRTEMLKVKLKKAHDMIQLKRKETKADTEKYAKAEWAICLCTRRAEELEASINEEIAATVDLEKELDYTKEVIGEIRAEVEEKKSKHKSLTELLQELSGKLQLSSQTKSCQETQLERVVTETAQMICEIEELRWQRDIFNRRIKFCMEKDAIGMASKLADLGFSYKEFTLEEIREATDDFSERLRLKSSGDWKDVYRGRINHTTVAIKLCNSARGISQEVFPEKVKLLSHVRHPHLVAMIGFCSEPKCIVYEYMHNGCLRDALFSVRQGSRTRSQGLRWPTRIRIAAGVSSALGFLHSAKPRPIAHRNLNPSKILLDHNLVPKVHGLFRRGWRSGEPYLQSDVRAFGNLIMQLLTGRNWAGLVKEAVLTDRTVLVEVLDEIAGEWPLDLAVELAGIGMRCLSENGDLSMATVSREVERVREKTDEVAGNIDCEVAAAAVPIEFICPILKEVMKNPHLAADGFSYELEAIEEWLTMGHDTSPVTNLKLGNNLLTPNHTLRWLIYDWHDRRSIPLA